MVYNNPPIYKNDVTPDILATLTDCENIVCFKDSSGDTRRFIDLRNTVGDRFVLFAGLDDVVVESIRRRRGRLDLRNVQRLPARRGNVIPSRPPAALRRGDGVGTAGSCRCCISMRVRIWCSASSCVKSCWAAVAPFTRPPRLALEGETRQQVVAIVEQALATRPTLPDVGL